MSCNFETGRKKEALDQRSAARNEATGSLRPLMAAEKFADNLLWPQGNHQCTVQKTTLEGRGSSMKHFKADCTYNMGKVRSLTLSRAAVVHVESQEVVRLYVQSGPHHGCRAVGSLIQISFALGASHDQYIHRLVMLHGNGSDYYDTSRSMSDSTDVL